MTTLNPFDLLDDGAEDPSQIAVSIAADKPKKLAPVSAVFAKSSVPSRQLAQPVREARSDTPRGGGHGGGDGGFSRGRGGCNRDFRGGDGNSKPSEEAGVSKPLYEKRSVYGGARRGGGRRGEAGDGEHPRRTFERHSGTDREGDIKSEEAGCGNWGTPGEEVVVVETEEVAGVETEKPAGDEVAADANKENTAEVEEQKESEDKGSDKDKRKDDKEEKAVNINEFWKPGEGENYYRGGGRGGRGRGRGGRDGEGASGGGFDGYRSEAAPAVGDTAQFPSLGGK
uniref:Hyaluronan/mRNA-binding protein domain-containing protein n=1 Tax=Brassica oleracea var. oleracea TaxID=109376 RepID=A0A0D3EGL1_BRAOL